MPTAFTNYLKKQLMSAAGGLGQASVGGKSSPVREMKARANSAKELGDRLPSFLACSLLACD